MNKKEIAEIRKQFTPDHSTIDQIAGCYVDHEKIKKFSSVRSFLSFDEDEAYKYFDLFKKTLSGTLGKNLINMEFPLQQEEADGNQAFLLKLRQSKLKDEALLDEFYDRIIDSYYCAENYYIMLIHATYDVPSKAKDGMEMFDASDSVYDFILCSICPVNLSKPGLSYDAGTNEMALSIRDWCVDAPVKGFLFPAFNDRATDIHSVLYYSKKAEELQPDFISCTLGSVVPMTAAGQKEAFDTLLMTTLGEDCDYEVVKTVHETICEMIEMHADDPEPLTLDKMEVQKVLEKSGATNESLETFSEEYDIIADPKTPMMATNLVDTKKFKIETPDIVINVSPDATDLIETKMVDGRQCLVIAVDDHIQVNGLDVKTLHTEKEPEDNTSAFVELPADDSVDFQ